MMRIYQKMTGWVLVLFFCNIMSTAFAQTDPPSSRILIIWKDNEHALFTYTLEPKGSNQICIRLETSDGQTNTTVVKYEGGFESMFSTKKVVLNELEARTNSVKSTQKQRMLRSLEIRFISVRSMDSSVVSGDPSDLNKFFQSSAAVKRLLLFVSENQPKAYRLINEAGQNKAIMRPPPGWKAD